MKDYGFGLMLVLTVLLGACDNGAEGDVDSKPEPPTKEKILEHIMGTWVAAEGSPKDITFIFAPNGDKTMTQTTNGHKRVSDGRITKQWAYTAEANFFIIGSSIQIPNYKHERIVVKMGVKEISADTMLLRYEGKDYRFKKQ